MTCKMRLVQLTMTSEHSFTSCPLADCFQDSLFWIFSCPFDSSSESLFGFESAIVRITVCSSGFSPNVLEVIPRSSLLVRCLWSHCGDYCWCSRSSEAVEILVALQLCISAITAAAIGWADNPRFFHCCGDGILNGCT